MLVTTDARPRTIHDFGGFPKPLYAVQYPAPGDPALADQLVTVLAAFGARPSADWGLDHGTWSVLVHAFPDADIPVVQMSINAERDPAYHFELGAALAPLRRNGVLILGSGNVVHNLRSLDWEQPELAYDWALRFGDDATARMLGDPEAVGRLDAHLDYREAAPTPEHFLPLLYIAGLAAADNETADLLIGGYMYGGLSMAAYTVGAQVRVPPADGLTAGAQETGSIQDKPDAPVEDSNI